MTSKVYFMQSAPLMLVLTYQNAAQVAATLVTIECVMIVPWSRND